MPFPSSQRSRPAAPQNKAGGQSNAVPATPGTKKYSPDSGVLESGGNEPSKIEWETGTTAPQG